MSQSFPTDVKLKYVPYSKAADDIAACANPIALDLAKLFPGKTIVLTSAPGAFTPTCTEQHVPGYLKKIDEFKLKGVDKIIILTANDPFVNAAWGKALGYKDEENYVVFATDPNAALSKELGDEYLADLTGAGFGLRTGRYAAIVKDGKTEYLKAENGGSLTDIATAENILGKL